MTRTNNAFLVLKGLTPTFLIWVSCWKLIWKIVLCRGNCCQFGEQLSTAQISPICPECWNLTYLFQCFLYLIQIFVLTLIQWNMFIAMKFQAAVLILLRWFCHVLASLKVPIKHYGYNEQVENNFLTKLFFQKHTA